MEADAKARSSGPERKPRQLTSHRTDDVTTDLAWLHPDDDDCQKHVTHVKANQRPAAVSMTTSPKV